MPPIPDKISGQIVDLVQNRIFPGTIHISEGRIQSITPQKEAPSHLIMPGFVDAHIHIESSMLPPSEFARFAVIHGTVATVSDPHEIGNVLGVRGVEFMIEDGKRVPLKFHFGAPSCVPATTFETAGAIISVADVEALLSRPDVFYLSEMMNFPGVIHGETEVLQKIELARRLGKPVDGHAPGLRGVGAVTYFKAGISTDHECVTLEEALEKIGLGVKILIREGSATKDFEALQSLLFSHADICMFCSDDLHPDNLMLGHINLLIQRALKLGAKPLDVLKVASLNPVRHYGLKVGLLQEGDFADFVIVDNFENFQVQLTCIDGKVVAEKGKSYIPRQTTRAMNHFHTSTKNPTEFRFVNRTGSLNVIGVLKGQVVTESLTMKPFQRNGEWVTDIESDVLKIAVVNRYQNRPPAVGFIKNFGLKSGALASSVAHDSHNIVAVGVDDESLAEAVNLVIENQGGISAVGDGKKMVLPLPIAGLMSLEDGTQVAAQYGKMDQFAKQLGSKLPSPFMTLSFMALLVIPNLKMSDLGLFSFEKFSIIEPV